MPAPAATAPLDRPAPERTRFPRTPTLRDLDPTRLQPEPEPERRVGYELHDKQWEALQLLGLDPESPVAEPVEELLYGGQAGGGKSHLLRALGVTLCSMWPGAAGVLFRRTYQELEDSHIRWIQQEVGAPIATYHVGRHELRFANGSVLMFRHCEEETTVFTYNTSEWPFLLVDQAEAFTEFQLRFLRSRVRQPRHAFADSVGGPWRPIVVLSANPGGISHGYLRAAYVDPAPPGQVHVAPEDDGGARRCYLPARLADNPSLDAEQYRRTLRGLPPHLQRAYLEGDWNAVLGSFFEQWRASDADGAPYHVWPEGFARAHYAVPYRDPETDAEAPFPPHDWLHWAAVDGGVRDPWCVLFAALAPDRRVVVYRELYAPGTPVPEQARVLRGYARDRDEVGDPTGHPPLDRILADPAMFANRANMSISDARVYRSRGVGLTRGTNRRAQGWRRVADLLAPLDDGYPGLVVLEGACPNLVRTLPLLQASQTDHEDISAAHGRADPTSPTSIRDDAADCLRYLVNPAAVAEVDFERVEIEALDGGAGAEVDVGDDRDARWGLRPIAALGQTGIRSGLR